MSSIPTICVRGLVDPQKAACETLETLMSHVVVRKCLKLSTNGLWDLHSAWGQWPRTTPRPEAPSCSQAAESRRERRLSGETDRSSRTTPGSPRSRRTSLLQHSRSPLESRRQAGVSAKGRREETQQTLGGSLALFAPLSPLLATISLILVEMLERSNLMPQGFRSPGLL